MSINNERINKMYLHTRNTLLPEREINLSHLLKMNVPQDHNSKWNKKDTQAYISHSLSYMRNTKYKEKIKDLQQEVGRQVFSQMGRGLRKQGEGD